MTRTRTIASWTLFPATLTAAVGGAYYIVTHDLPIEWAALGIPLAVIALVALLERLMPFNPAWNRNHGDVGADVSSLVLVAGVVESLIGALYPALAALAYIALEREGWVSARFPADWPLLAQVVLLVLLADLAKYWFHRFGHETDLGWRLHSVHHSVKRVYWLNGFRIHPLYHLINFVIAILPWVCLGASPEVVALYTVVLAVSAAFQHANVDLKHGFLNRVFNTNELHRWHHSRRLDEANANYGAVLLVWDQLFGSYRRQPPGAPAELGMVSEANYPMNSYVKQLLVPFAWKAMVERK